MNHEEIGHYHSNASSLELWWNSASHSNPSLLEKWPGRGLNTVGLKGRMCPVVEKALLAIHVLWGKTHLQIASLDDCWVFWSHEIHEFWTPLGSSIQHSAPKVAFDHLFWRDLSTSSPNLSRSKSTCRLAIAAFTKGSFVWNQASSQFSFELKCIGRKDNICNILEIWFCDVVSQSAAKYFLTLLHMLCSCVCVEFFKGNVITLKPSNPKALQPKQKSCSRTRLSSWWNVTLENEPLTKTAFSLAPGFQSLRFNEWYGKCKFKMVSQWPFELCRVWEN